MVGMKEHVLGAVNFAPCFGQYNWKVYFNSLRKNFSDHISVCCLVKNWPEKMFLPEQESII